MSQKWIKATYYRGGTSKGVFFQKKDLPTSDQNKLNEVLVTKTKACNTSIRLYRLPLTFTLSLQLKMLIKANYNQQMYSTSHSTISMWA